MTIFADYFESKDLEVKAYSLMDGVFSVDNTKKFQPFDPLKDDPAQLPHGSNILGISPFLVVTDSDLVLLDSGLGAIDTNGQPMLLKNLSNIGINPSDVTKVILSHLHKDHIKGLGKLTQDGQLDFLFPQAKLFFQKKEMEYALGTDTPSFDKNYLSAIANHPNNQLLDGDGQLTSELSYFVTGGHSPCHQAIKFSQNDQTIFFGADVAPLLFQMKHNLVAKYDYDGRVSSAYRKEWWQKGQEEHWEFLFYHDYKTPIFNC